MSTKPKTAFVYYMESCKEVFERNKQIEAKKIIEFMKTCSSQWKSMSHVDKQPYDKLAKESKSQHAQDKQALGAKACVFKRRYEFSNPPLSAFYWYCREHRDNFLALNPQLTGYQIYMELGLKWLTSNWDVRKQFRLKSEDDWIRYAKELKAENEKS